MANIPRMGYAGGYIKTGMKKYLFLGLMWASVCAFAAEPIYHAGENSVTTGSPRWEASLGWINARVGTHDPTEENLFSHLTGLTVRGLYTLRPSWRMGAEGVIFSGKNLAPSNTYRARRYGVLVNYVLTPDTVPVAYVLVGGGETYHRISYSGLRTNRKHTGYACAGIGIEVPLDHRYFFAAEAAALYHASKKIDVFTRLNRRLETTVTVRGGIRF